jgi:hypothetical protein
MKELKMRFRARFLGKFLIGMVALAALGEVVMLLWNLILPDLFAGIRPIDYWHGLGLLVLSRILFGGFHGHHGRLGRQHWEKWASMTPEEREQFRKERWAAHGERCNRGQHRGHADPETAQERP